MCSVTLFKPIYYFCDNGIWRYLDTPLEDWKNLGVPPSYEWQNLHASLKCQYLTASMLRCIVICHITCHIT